HQNKEMLSVLLAYDETWACRTDPDTERRLSKNGFKYLLLGNLDTIEKIAYLNIFKAHKVEHPKIGEPLIFAVAKDDYNLAAALLEFPGSQLDLSDIFDWTMN